MNPPPPPPSRRLGLRPFFAIGGLLGMAPSLAATEPTTLRGWLARAANQVTATAQEGAPEFYVPVHTYHMRWAYTQEKIDSYQENTFGLGYGHGRFDEKGNWHGLYAVGFQDSHFKPEWLAGYGWKTYWNLSPETKVGLGYTAGFTTRSDIGAYTPVPLILPIGSVDYRNASLETAFLPGGKGYGNILFFWLKWHLGTLSPTSKVAP
jgi:hypothetical protein